MGQTVPMRLPFAPNTEWVVIQGNNGALSHHGASAYCWDFGATSGSSKGLPVYAVAPGDVVDVHLNEGWFYVKHADGEFFAYVHCDPNSVKVKVGEHVTTGKELSAVGEQGTDNYHLHVALSNIVGKLPAEGGNPVPFATLPSQFSDYEVLDQGANVWEQVVVGVPVQGQVIRNTRPWSGWRADLGAGTLRSGPGAVVSKGGHIHVFAQGDDRHIWHSYWSNHVWSGWRSDMPNGTFTSDPTAIVDGSGHLHVFARGDDRNVWHSYWNGTVWSSWRADLGIGTFQSSPCAVVAGGGDIHVFAEGDDRNIWHSFWNGTKWSGWRADLGVGTFTSSPCAVMSGSTLHVFAMGDDRHFWHSYWNGSAWSGWRSDLASGTFISGPACVKTPDGRLHLFGRGDDRNIWRSTWSGRHWSPWMANLGAGTLISGPAAIVDDSGHIHVFAEGDDRNIWHSFA